jgi:cell division protein FtsI/penicillin-binding protein 2
MSLNTGASQMLKYMGGGDFTKAGREKWHDYLVNHYRFGQKTGIEQGYEEGGIVPDPNEGFGLNIRYANTTFGQGTSQTPIQMAAAFSALVNGGTYYQPTLVHSIKQADGSLKPHQPTVLARDVLSPSDSQQVTGYMQTLVERFYSAAARPGYRVGGKTGTAQIADPNGGYYADRFNGSFVGFIGGDKIEYVVYVRVDDPKVQGYAGLKAAGPIFVTTAQMLLNNFNIQPKTAK